jgi:hypothetical protein
VRATLAVSYDDLDPAAAQMFRILGVHPGPAPSVAVLAAMADRPLEAARAALDALLTRHLAGRHGPDRLALHDLVRLYAADRTTERATHEPLRRALHWYRLALTTAVEAIDPEDNPTPADDDSRGLTLPACRTPPRPAGGSIRNCPT